MIQHHTSSSASDVWSCKSLFIDEMRIDLIICDEMNAVGVVVWEIFSLGVIPYRELTNKQVVEYILEGGRLEKPHRCPEEIFALMLKCWHIKPDGRPSFEYLRNGIVRAFPDVFKNEFASLCESFLYHSRGLPF